jgi:hypothetical protein
VTDAAASSWARAAPSRSRQTSREHKPEAGLHAVVEPCHGADPLA